ncbi:MAG: serine/threonine-protein kinase [Deltaproteobacteria bacterium]|nr:serine/threonine-protein kinase [Deltaproteobacteria bacterium]
MPGGKPLKKGQRIAKYRLLKKLGEGTFGEVWRAKDLVEGINVALKIPQPEWNTKEHQKIFQDEVRLVAPLDHHNILKIKNADVLGKRFVIVTECGKEALSDRLQKPRNFKFIASVMGQILSALAYAHRHKIIHRDIKPENVILFADGTARITDFGIAKVVEKTLIRGEGTGTIGYMAPEQAYGQTSHASDVFSLGILFYQMLTGVLPPWPFEWPYPRHKQLLKKAPLPVLYFIRKATAFNPVRRYPNCVVMEQAWLKAVKNWKMFRIGKIKKHRKPLKPLHWRDYKVKTFVQQNRAKLRLDFLCRKCEQPISEFMRACPWCGDAKNNFRKITTFPASCDRCHHGTHLDWHFCPWCYRERFKKIKPFPSKDKRYTEHCTNPRCRKPMIPFMSYCPYCHKKVAKAWRHPSLPDRCPSCRWGVAKDYWEFCAWCALKL